MTKFRMRDDIKPQQAPPRPQPHSPINSLYVFPILSQKIKYTFNGKFSFFVFV